MAGNWKRQATQEYIDAAIALSDSELEDVDIDDPTWSEDEASEVSDEDAGLSDDRHMAVSDDDGACQPGPSTSTGTHTHTWTKVASVKHTHPEEVQGVIDFTSTPGVIGFDDLSPYDSFSKFFPDQIYSHVAAETNRYAAAMIAKLQRLPRRSRYHNWRDITPGEIKAFIALEIAMGIVHQPTLEEYFQSTFWLTATPGFRSVFARPRYDLIRSFLHFANNDDKENDEDRLYKIKPIIDIVKDLYALSYSCHKELSIDDSVIKFKGRVFSKHYPPSKPLTKWRMKIWSMCDPHTGYLLKFNVCTGKEPNLQQGDGLGSRVVQTLLQGYENKGHVLFVDNFYSSVGLFDALRLNNIGACGTVRANRKGLPMEMRRMKIKRGELPVIWHNDDKTMLACTWQNTGKVNMLSTVGDYGTKEGTIRSKKGDRKVDKPSVQVLCNKYMGGVNLFYQLCSTYPFNRRSRKWYQALWHFIIEVALINSHICYNIQNPTKKLNQRAFRKKVVTGMLEGHSLNHSRRCRRNEEPLETRLTERHFISHSEDKKMKPNCIVCTILPSQCSKKGKGACKRKQTTYFCKDCPSNPPLCITPCFKVYHKQKKFKKTCQCK